jgi:hypothetical protein
MTERRPSVPGMALNSRMTGRFAPATSVEALMEQAGSCERWASK